MGHLHPINLIAPLAGSDQAQRTHGLHKTPGSARVDARPWPQPGAKQQQNGLHTGSPGCAWAAQQHTKRDMGAEIALAASKAGALGVGGN